MKRALALATAACAALALALVPPVSEASGRIEMNIGSLAPRGTPWMDTLEEMKKRIEEATNGRIHMIIRPPGVMSEVEMVRATRTGDRLQGAGVTTAAIAEGGNVPQLQLVELPFLFNTNAEADYVLDNVLWEPMSQILHRRGFVLTVWSENGWRSFATKGKPIRKPEDLAQFKMRSQESDVHLEMYRMYGAQAIQRPMTEVLTALQANIVDGLDNTALYIQAGGLAEPLDYFTFSRHIYQPAAIVLSRRWFERLPEDIQGSVRDVRDLATEGRAAIRAEEAAMMENFALFGVEIIELSPEEREAFASKARDMHQPFAARIDGGADLLQQINQALARQRAN